MDTKHEMMIDEKTEEKGGGGSPVHHVAGGKAEALEDTAGSGSGNGGGGSGGSGSGASSSTHLEQIDNQSLDVDSYASDYTGVTKVKRLQYIAQRCPKLSIRAFRMAITELKRGINIELYQDVVAVAQQLHPEQFPIDTSWIQVNSRKNQERLNVLEQNLVSQKQNMLREAIRVAFTELAEFYFNRGEYQAALAKYVEAKDHCSKSEQQLEMSLNIIKTSILLGSMAHVKTEVSRALSIDSDKAKLNVNIGKLKASLGLYFLRNNNYLMAAKNFHEAHPDVAGRYKEVISGKDIAIYGGLCALASCARRDLKRDVLDNENFKSFLEPVPYMREIIYDFYASRYASCMVALEKLKPDLKLDFYLSSHVDKLFKDIRAKALTQYFSPFTSVNMHKMAHAFNVPIDALEEEVASLIVDGKIQGRIDSHQKVLYTKHTDQRSATFKQALEVGERYIQDMKSMLLRMSLVKHDFIVRHEAGRGEDEEGYYSGEDDEYMPENGRRRDRQGGGGGGRRNRMQKRRMDRHK